MNAVLRRLVTMSGVFAAMVMPTPPAEAKATLEARVVGATCTVTMNDGITSAVPCSPDSWVVALQPNWSAQMVATIEYAYADDGLPLARPQGITIVAPGVRTVFYEAGALYVGTSFCNQFGYICQTGRGWEQFTGQPNAYPPVFISDNEIADSLSGTLTVTTGAFFGPPPPLIPSYTWSPNIFVSLSGVSLLTFSGIDPVTAVPEPGSFVLTLLGLGVLAAGTVRRRARHALTR